MAKELDVICIGAAIVDIPLRPVGKHIFDEQSYPLERIAMTVGGDAINEATILSRLGHKTALISLVGQDAAGQFVLDACKKDLIDTKSVRIDKQIDTSINIALVGEDGERTFVTSRSGSLWKMTATDIDIERFQDARLLSLASIFNNPLLDGAALCGIFQEAKQQGLIICADTIYPRLGETLEDIREALSYVDYFFPNVGEAEMLTGKDCPEKMADVLLACGVGNVIIKLGKQGCFIKNALCTFQSPACPAIKVHDTIGAGDNFVAGFLTALLDGKSIEDCARFANATAAISVQFPGATSGVQNRQQVDDLLYNLHLTDKEG